VTSCTKILEVTARVRFHVDDRTHRKAV